MLPECKFKVGDRVRIKQVIVDAKFDVAWSGTVIGIYSYVADTFCLLPDGTACEPGHEICVIRDDCQGGIYSGGWITWEGWIELGEPIEATVGLIDYDAYRSFGRSLMR
jgi:hypothetical protein